MKKTIKTVDGVVLTITQINKIKTMLFIGLIMMFISGAIYKSTNNLIKNKQCIKQNNCKLN